MPAESERFAVLAHQHGRSHWLTGATIEEVRRSFVCLLGAGLGGYFVWNDSDHRWEKTDAPDNLGK